MSVEVGIGNETPKRSQGPSLPSDFSDVQPRSYDPEFISDISNKMQVPHRIAVGADDVVNGDMPEADFDDYVSRPMNVPDRIILTGSNEHAAMRSRLQQFQFDSAPSAPDMSYVNLITPPRTLTLGEGFPTVEDHVMEDQPTGEDTLQLQHTQMNGAAVPVPFTPGISPNDSLLLNEEAEGTLLRTQLAKLTRRLTVMEQENQKRSQREILLYPMVFGYFLFKVFGWFFRSGR